MKMEIKAMVSRSIGLFTLLGICFLWTPRTRVMSATVQKQGAAESIPAAGNAVCIAAADVTGDGKEEILYACYNGQVCAQDKDSGKVIWRYNTRAYPHDLVAGDFNGDGQKETLVACADGSLYALSARGQLMWKFTSENEAILFTAAIARISRDKVWIFTGSADCSVYVLDEKGKQVKRLMQVAPPGLVRAGDLDGDGLDEVVIFPALRGYLGKKPGELVALTGEGLKTLWAHAKKGGKAKRMPRAKTPRYMRLEDLDGDGKCEILIGSRSPSGGVRVLSHEGLLLWEAANLFGKKQSEYRKKYQISYSSPTIVGCDVAPGNGKELVVLDANILFVFDHQGRKLDMAISPKVPFMAICAANRGKDSEVYLASSPNGDDRIYKIHFGAGWQKAFSDLKREGKMAHITENMEKIRRQIKAYTYPGPLPKKKYFNIYGFGAWWKLIEARKQGTSAVDWLQKQFPYKNIHFVQRVHFRSNEVLKVAIPGLARKDRSTGWQSPLSPEEIVKNAKAIENSKMYFFASIGHGCRPTISVELAERMLKACPDYCLGFEMSENSQAFQKDHKPFVVDYLYPLLDVCKKYGKKVMMIEKLSWWVDLPAMYEKLGDGTYADVLVPSIEDSGARMVDLNLAGRAGLYLSGAVKDLAARTCPDDWQYRKEYHCYPMTGHPFLRKHITQILLGARYHDPKMASSWYPYNSWDLHQEGMAFTTIGSEFIEIVTHMVGKGLLIAPDPKDIIGVSPVVLQMRRPTDSFLKHAYSFRLDPPSYVDTSTPKNRLQYLDPFDVDPDERKSPFEGIARQWAGGPVKDHYLGSYLTGQKRHAIAHIPATPYGYMTIVPKFRDFKKCFWAKDRWETDGTFLYNNKNEKLNGVEARPLVLADFQSRAKELPFRAEGYVFMQAQRINKKKVRLTLVDPGILDPDDRDVTIHVQTKKPIHDITDILSRERLEIKNKKVKLTVPAGVFRILEVRYGQVLPPK